VVVVFDGDDIDGRSSRAARTVRVEFSASHEEADDAIVRMVRRDASSRPYVVVTSDRDLGDRCRRLGADVLDSTAFRQL
jgi:rRNA-processing protein FCF1